MGGASGTNQRTAIAASATPTAPPIGQQSARSRRSSAAITRPRDAPSASRTANSRLRAAARAESSVARFKRRDEQQAKHRGEHHVERACAHRRRAVGVQSARPSTPTSLFIVDRAASRRRSRSSRSALRRRVTPGFSRATARPLLPRHLARQLAGLMVSGVQQSGSPVLDTESPAPSLRQPRAACR